MLGIDRHAARVTWTVFLIALSIILFYAAKRAILLFILAIFFAYMLAPIVQYLERFTPRRVSRKLSLATVYSALVTILIVGGIGLGSRLSEEGTTLFTKLPDLLKSQNLATRPMPGWLEPYRERIVDAVTTQVEAGAKELVPLLQRAGGKLATFATGLLFLVLVPILSFFFLKDASDIRRHFVGFFYGDPNLPVVEQVLNDLHNLLGKYIRALALLSGATFVSYMIFLGIAGVPYSVLLAAIAAPLEFIPVVGPLTASVIILLVASFSGYQHLLWIVIFLGAYRIFQDYVLAPYLMSEGVELHPLLVIFGVLAGEEIGGISGMIISVPLIATLRVIFVRLQMAKQTV